MTDSSTNIERELDTFRRELPKLLAEPANLGKFALVSGNDVLGLYPSFETGLAAGYDRIGLAPFLVKEVADHEQPKYFSRNIRCPAH